MSIFSAPSFYSQADQDIYNRGFSFVPQEQFRGGAFAFPTAPTTTTGGITALPVTAMNMGGGGGGIPFSGTTSDLITGFMDTITDRQDRLNNPPDKFFGFDTMRDQQLTGADAGFYDTIPQEQTFAGKVQDFLTPQSADEIMEEGYSPRFKGILGTILPDRYSTLPRYDQAFIAANMGYTGPTVFGQDQSGLYKDPFGFNVRSAFGNYGEKVGKEAQKSGDALVESAAKRGLTFDKSKGALVDAAGNVIDQDDYDASMLDFINQTKFLRNKFNYFTQKTLERDALKKEEFEKPGGTKDQVADLQAKINAGEFDSTSDKPDRDLGSVTKESAAKTSGVGGGGYTKSDTKRDDRRGGQYGFMDGGIVDMLEIYD